MILKARCLGSSWAKQYLAIERMGDGFFFDPQVDNFVKGITDRELIPFRRYTIFDGYKWLQFGVKEEVFTNGEFSFLLFESQWPFKPVATKQLSAYIKAPPYAVRSPELSVILSGGTQ